MINISRMSKYYGEYPAVIDVSFNISKGESIGLLGPNGAGKTTAFYIIVGLIASDNGSVSLNDRDINQ